MCKLTKISSHCERAVCKAGHIISARRSNPSSNIVEGETLRSCVLAGVVRIWAPVVEEIELLMLVSNLIAPPKDFFNLSLSYGSGLPIIIVPPVSPPVFAVSPS